MVILCLQVFYFIFFGYLPNRFFECEFFLKFLLEDVLYNYIEYPFKVTAFLDVSISTVSSASECAYQCNKGILFRVLECLLKKKRV